MSSSENGIPALLALADGRVFRGRSFGATGEVAGEVVFNTAMTGWVRSLISPSIRTLTKPFLRMSSKSSR